MRNQALWDRFTCHQCGRCCSALGLPYERDALSAIAEYLQLTVDEVLITYYGRKSVDGQHIEFDQRKRKPCPFLVFGENRAFCGIYQVRPNGCREYPFNTDFGRCDVRCPGAEEVFVSFGKKI